MTGNQTTSSNPSNSANGVAPFRCWNWWLCNDEETILLCCLCISVAGIFFSIYYTIACIIGYEACCCECCACCCYKKIYDDARRKREEQQKKICKCMKNGVRTHRPPSSGSPVCKCVCSACKPEAVAPSPPSMDVEGIQSVAHASNEEIVLVIDPQGHAVDTTTSSAHYPLSPPAYTETGMTYHETWSATAPSLSPSSPVVSKDAELYVEPGVVSKDD